MKEKQARKLAEHAVERYDIREALSVSHYNEERQELVAADGFRLVVIKIDPCLQPFPNYVILIPDSKRILSTMEVNVSDLYKIASLFMNTKCTSVRMILEDKTIKCCSGPRNDPEDDIIYTEAYLPVSTVIGQKTDVKVAVNPKYLLDTAKALKSIKESTKCKIAICSPSAPITFKAGDYTEVVMPMYVKWEV